MNHVAVLTSGGDAPGMNAAIRAVVRTSVTRGLRVSGVYRGFQGLLDDDVHELGPRSVANVIQRGGTILRTARCTPFLESSGRSEAAATMARHDIDGLIVIGGDGSFRGASKLHEEHGISVIGVPGTIDNDIFGTDVSIGFNTAINIALDAVDRLRDTAASHDRVFLVEVMGRNSGHIALNVGVAGGAEAILYPERTNDAKEVADLLRAAEARGKSSSVIVVAEGAYPGGAMGLERALQERTASEVRTSILGHVQRGGSPSTRDRVLASRLGFMAVEGLIQGRSGVMVGIDKRGNAFIPLKEVWENVKPIDAQLVELATVLAV
ncbi:MAG: 6-phosphofructokinase [Trueperaceae bacterium]|nr:6-phosphofructokinase [Trueperaceae bacterium]